MHVSTTKTRLLGRRLAFLPPTKVSPLTLISSKTLVHKHQVHSFTCGFTIGAAFLSCGSTMGWTITSSTLIHEVPSEMADFVALLNGGMSIKQVGFACSVSVVARWLAGCCWPRAYRLLSHVLVQCRRLRVPCSFAPARPFLGSALEMWLVYFSTSHLSPTCDTPTFTSYVVLYIAL